MQTFVDYLPETKNYIPEQISQMFGEVLDNALEDKETPLQSLSDSLLPNTYFSSAEYLAKSAQEKQSLLWSQVTHDTTSADWPNVAGIFLEGMNESFDSAGDAMPSGKLFGTRTKYIHSVGAVGKVKFQSASNHDYTGIFKGANYGLIRLSSAAAPSKSQPLAPGMGLKFLRSGMDSANLVSMFSVDGQPDDWNFFSNDFTNHITAPSGAATQILGKKFATATKYIQEVGLEDFSSHDELGQSEEALKLPFSLRFEPSSDVHSLFPKDEPSNYSEYMNQLPTVPAGSTLYKVYGMDAPEELGGTEVHIGDLVLDGNLVASKWGDQNLFFRHQRLDDDLKVQPSWAPYEASFGCPFKGFLSQE
uniref:Uncharacterized protein n=1 Tax=Strombidium rassoulzadegani TaxID=1082188 RepID=A0A7S3FXK1_9SPIT